MKRILIFFNQYFKQKERNGLESNLTVERKNRKGLTRRPTSKTNNVNQEQKSETKRYITGQEEKTEASHVADRTTWAFSLRHRPNRHPIAY